MLRFDHLAVSALTMAEGVAAVEAALGLSLSAGGQHPNMATHNRLIGMGDLYLEVIAPDPSLPRPKWPRWFDLDGFSGPPRLTNWVTASDAIAVDLAQSPVGTGVPVNLARGDYRWTMAVPADGRLPFDGGFPALIQWHGNLHPARTLPDCGLRLRRFEIAHPQATALREALRGRLNEPRLIITEGPAKAMRASFDTPHGPRVLE